MADTKRENHFHSYIVMNASLISVPIVMASEESAFLDQQEVVKTLVRSLSDQFALGATVLGFPTSVNSLTGRKGESIESDPTE